jgi:peptidoglycan biosynthesis protein MviN/MurJ (putative lipid II flippase)
VKGLTPRFPRLLYLRRMLDQRANSKKETAMKTLKHGLIALAAATIVTPAFAARHDATTEQFYSYTTPKSERASQQPLWAPDLNDRNAVY